MNRSHLIAQAAAISVAGALVATPAVAQTTQERLDQLLRQLETQQKTVEALSKEVERVKKEQSKQEMESASGGDYEVSTKGGLKIQSKDKKFKFQVGGRIMTDYAHYGEDKSELGDGTEFRRARVFLKGTLYKDWDFKWQVDFAGNGVDVKDMYLKYKFKPHSITIGQFKQPFSLEELTSSKYITFMERALPNVLAPGRRIGVGYHTHGDNWSFALAGSGEGTDGNPGGEGDERYSLTSRVHFSPMSEKTQNVHLGAAMQYSNLRDASFRLRQRPESHVTSTRFVDTGTIANADTFFLYGLEAAGVAGPFSIQGEYMNLSLEREAGLSDLDFYGWYGFASFFLTPGDQRSYDPKKGAFGRVKPKHPYDEGGYGAWEIGVRYSGLMLTDEDVLGGGERNLTIGLNWYATSHIRFMLNYVNVNNDNNATGNAGNLLPQFASGANDDPHVIQLRAQIDF